MNQCESLEGCLFFNDKMPIDSAFGKLYKDKYCLDKFEDCARHKVKTELGRDKVPSNLYPNMQERADQIISESLVGH